MMSENEVCANLWDIASAVTEVGNNTENTECRMSINKKWFTDVLKSAYAIIHTQGETIKLLARMVLKREEALRFLTSIPVVEGEITDDDVDVLVDRLQEGM